MPTQGQTDLSSSDPANSSGSGWGDMDGGVAARPYVKSLSIVNDGVSTPVVENGQPGGLGMGAGGVGAVITPFNLCRAGQAPAPGQCYARPNRVGIAIVHANGMNAGWDFSNAVGQATSPSVTASSIIDMTIALNTLGTSLRWSWINGDLLYWQPTNLGRADATVRIKFRPVTTPWITNFPAGNGCTATPIFNCDIQRADAEGLGANLFLSLDTTLDTALTGAAFATQGAINGFLSPGGTAQAPSLDMQVSSSHFRSDGSLQQGTLKAFLPAAALLNLYGLLPADAGTNFTATRSGSAGTNGAPRFTPWTAVANGADGLLVSVSNISFSAPTYLVKSKLRASTSKATAAAGLTKVTATVAACTMRTPCTATVYALGRNLASRRFAATPKLVLRSSPVRWRSLALNLSSTKLPRSHRYLLVVRQGRKLVASTTSVVR